DVLAKLPEVREWQGATVLLCDLVPVVIHPFQCRVLKLCPQRRVGVVLRSLQRGEGAGWIGWCVIGQPAPEIIVEGINILAGNRLKLVETTLHSGATLKWGFGVTEVVGYAFTGCIGLLSHVVGSLGDWCADEGYV